MECVYCQLKVLLSDDYTTNSLTICRDYALAFVYYDR